MISQNIGSDASHLVQDIQHVEVSSHHHKTTWPHLGDCEGGRHSQKTMGYQVCRGWHWQCDMTTCCCSSFRYSHPMYSLFSYYCTISTKCLATVTCDGKCSVSLSSDLSRMCDMDKKCSVQHKFIWRCCQVSHCHPRLWRSKWRLTQYKPNMLLKEREKVLNHIYWMYYWTLGSTMT